MVRLQWLLLCGLALGVPAAASADLITVPVATQPETGGTSTIFRSAARTYMALYTGTNFASITTPVNITGMQVRMSALGNTTIPGTWPSQSLSFTNFDVQLSQASSQLLTDGEFLSGTGAFSSYQAGTITTTRSGPLSIVPGVYNNTGGTNAFGPTVNFTTPYLYTPGQSLILYLTHTGYLPATEPQPFFANADFANGVTDAISSTVGYQAANSNGFSSPYIIQFTYAAVPEPGSMALCGVAVCGGLAAWRRRRSAAAATAG